MRLPIDMMKYANQRDFCTFEHFSPKGEVGELNPQIQVFYSDRFCKASSAVRPAVRNPKRNVRVLRGGKLTARCAAALPETSHIPLLR